MAAKSRATYAGQPPSNGKSRQCEAAVAKDTKTRKKGERCPNAPIIGGNVCMWHGGKTPQVRQSATERLKQLVPPALTALHEDVTMKPSTMEERRHRLVAVRDALDRNGLGSKQKLEVTGAFASLDIKNLSEDMLRQILALKEQLGQAQPLEKPPT